jgi:TIR domain
MRVFISWSGHQSRLMAEALRDWLPRIFQTVLPWLSESEIHPGTRWARELEAALDKIDFGIVCLTRQNLLAPWVLFEAGALSKSVKTGRVVPYLLDLAADSLPAPLFQFQSIQADKIGTRRLLHAIADASPENVRPSPILDEVFETWWPHLHKRLGHARKAVTTIQRGASVSKEHPTAARLKTISDLVYSLENFHSNPEGIYYIGRTLIQCASFLEDHGAPSSASELVSQLLKEIDTDERKEIGAFDPVVSVSKVNELVRILKQLANSMNHEDA